MVIWTLTTTKTTNKTFKEKTKKQKNEMKNVNFKIARLPWMTDQSQFSMLKKANFTKFFFFLFYTNEIIVKLVNEMNYLNKKK